MTCGGDALPPFACIPGQTPRHAEGYFAPLHATARPGMAIAVLAGSAAFLVGFRYLDAGYFWEAHEVWEPVWHALPQNSSERRFVQALIQLANAELKLRMHRPRAARRLCVIAAAHLTEAGQAAGAQIMGRGLANTHDRITDCAQRVESFVK